jgi:hypothetical protein
LGEVEHAFRFIVVSSKGREAPAGLLLFFRPGLLDALVHNLETVIGVFQKDQAQDREIVLCRAELGVGAKLIGRGPETFFELVIVSYHEAP